MTSAAKKSNRLWAIFGILFLIFLLYVIYSANQETLPFFIRRLYMFPGGINWGISFYWGLLHFLPISFGTQGIFLFLGKDSSLAP